jgi:hypothetical protein
MIFYYWLPKLDKEQVGKGGQLCRKALEAAGLADVLADVREVPLHCSLANEGKGPDGGAGVLLTPVSKAHGVPEWVVYRPELMKFKPIGDGSKCWIGALIGQPPTPHDLERLKTLGGHEAEDSGGWKWKVPVARAPQFGKPYGVLPQSYTFDAAGEPTPNLNSEWQWLWDLSGEIRQWYVQADGLPEDATPEAKAAHKEPEFKQLVKWAARLLAVNYRVGPAELTLLHEMGKPVLTEAAVHATCQAAYGWDLVDEAKKKPVAEESPATS